MEVHPIVTGYLAREGESVRAVSREAIPRDCKNSESEAVKAAASPP
jgi:hypothetical protein